MSVKARAEEQIAGLRERIATTSTATTCWRIPKSPIGISTNWSDSSATGGNPSRVVTPGYPTQRVGGKPGEGLAAVEHTLPMLSLDNAYGKANCWTMTGVSRSPPPTAGPDLSVSSRSTASAWP